MERKRGPLREGAVAGGTDFYVNQGYWKLIGVQLHSYSWRAKQRRLNREIRSGVEQH